MEIQQNRIYLRIQYKFSSQMQYNNLVMCKILFSAVDLIFDVIVVIFFVIVLSVKICTHVLIRLE